MFTLSISHDGCEQHQLTALRHCEHRIDHLGHGLSFQGDAMGGTARISYACE